MPVPTTIGSEVDPANGARAKDGVRSARLACYSNLVRKPAKVSDAGRVDNADDFDHVVGGIEPVEDGVSIGPQRPTVEVRLVS